MFVQQPTAENNKCFGIFARKVHEWISTLADWAQAQEPKRAKAPWASV